MKKQWKIDPSHSEIQFKTKHLMITTVTGHFREFDLEVETQDDDFEGSPKISFKARAESIDTNNEQRDQHLRSADFFDAEQHPYIVFEGNELSLNSGQGKLRGDLTIKGVKKPVELDVEMGGKVIDGYGQSKAGFTVEGKISRKDFGLTWNQMTEAGQIVVSDTVRLLAEIQLVEQQQPVAANTPS